jgi:hypothetical protein
MPATLPEAAASPPPVFLICSERSGSNLIAAMMGAHPAVHAHPPWHLGRDLILNLHATLPEGPGGAAWRVLAAQAVAKVRDYRSAAEAERLAAFLAAQARLEPARIARFVWLELSDEARGRTVFVKENRVHRLMPFLIAAFPGVRFVFQVRDPRDYLASAKARGKVWGGNKFGSLRRALELWREDQEAGLAALGLLGAERVHFLRYEDLIADPAGRLSALCAFLGLPFDPAMLAFHATEAAARLAVPGGPRENLARPVMADNAGKYRRALSRGEVRTVEAHLGDLMDRFGYVRDFPAPRGRPSLWRAFRPMLSEPWERLLNGEIRPAYKTGHRRFDAALAAAARPLAPPLGAGG